MGICMLLIGVLLKTKGDPHYDPVAHKIDFNFSRISWQKNHSLRSLFVRCIICSIMVYTRLGLTSKLEYFIWLIAFPGRDFPTDLPWKSD